MRKKAIIFPFDFTLRHFKQFEGFIEKYEIVDYVTYKHDGDVPECDTVLVMDAGVPLREGFIYKWLVDHVDKFSEILDLRQKVSLQEKEEMKKICQHGIRYIEPVHEEFHWKNTDEPVVHIADVPVVLVQGAGDYCDKFHVELSIAREFKNDDFKVSHIGSKSYSHLFGSHDFPSFMTKSTLSMEERILAFSSYVKTIERKEQPDVIVIGVPQGIMPINEVFHGDFGMLNYMVSQAVEPDIVMFNTWLDDYNQEYIDEIKNLFKYKFGYPYDFMHLSNIQFDYMGSRELRTEHYLIYDEEQVIKKAEEMKALGCQVYNLLSDTEVTQVYQKMKQLLTGTDTLKYCI